MIIRHATPADAPIVAALEAAAFLPAEAASLAQFEERIAVFGDWFWLGFEEDGTLVTCVNGCLSDEKILVDEMFADTSWHNPSGAWFMVFGVMTHPDYQHRGYATQLLTRVLEDCRARGLAGAVLTCKDAKVGFYARVGFEDEGLSCSNHGGAVWRQMRCTF